MLEEVFRRWHPLVDIYPRCFVASKHIASMLSKAGFSIFGKASDGADLYMLKKDFTFKHRDFQPSVNLISIRAVAEFLNIPSK